MKILYIAKHESGGSDDEGAIAFALKQLGHDVRCLQQSTAADHVDKFDADFMLCHHWRDYGAISRCRMPKVFWCFDLIDSKDSTITGRDAERMAWAIYMVGICDIGFMTDGDWVAKDATGKLHWLMQGADERVVGTAPNKDFNELHRRVPILFAGGEKGGQLRRSFVAEMAATYKQDFVQVTNVYREPLRRLISQTDIVVAPDGPMSDRYWSNRVYNTLGFGGFLLHPYCARLFQQYDDGAHLRYYRSRAELHELIKFYRDEPELRLGMSQAGLQRTREQHLYRHRCEQLVATIKERLGI